MLATVVNENSDYGDEAEFARVLFGDEEFELTGSISRNDVDFLRVSSPAGGRIIAQVSAVPLEFGAVPYLQTVTTSWGGRSYTNLGGLIYNDGDEDPPGHRAPAYQLPWQDITEPGTVEHETFIEFTGVSGASRGEGELRQPSPFRFEWDISATTAGSVPTPTVPDSRYLEVQLRSTVLGGVTYDFQVSNYSGLIDTSITPENPLFVDLSGYVSHDRSFPESSVFDLVHTDSKHHYWEFVPDTFAPHIGIFNSAGELLLMRDTGSAVFTAPEAGEYYVAISRSAQFTPSTNEDRGYQRPYELSIATESDVLVEGIEPNPLESELVVSYRFDGMTPEVPTLTAFWADSESGAGQRSAIDTWDADRGFSVRVFNIESLPPAPEWATHFVVIADMDGKLIESSETNNRQGLLVIRDPHVQLVVGELEYEDSPNSGDSYMKSPFAAWIRITNNSLIPHEFVASAFNEYLGAYLAGHAGPQAGGFPDGFYAEWPLAAINGDFSDVNYPKVRTLGPLSRSDFLHVANYNLEWDWLPAPALVAFPTPDELLLEPFSSLPTMYLAIRTILDDYKSFSQGLEAFTASNWTKKLDKIARIANRIEDGYNAYKTITKPNPHFPKLDFAFNPIIVRDNVQLETSTQVIETISVPLNRLAEYEAAKVSLAAAQLAISNFFTAKNHRVALALAVSAYGSMEAAYALYTRAQDPPDPDYTMRVEPEVVDDESLQFFTDEHVADFFRQQLVIQSLNHAAARAHDKSDGAKLAGDAYWQAEQLIDASTFDHRGVLAARDVIALGTLTSAWLAEQEDDPTTALARLQTEGLGSEVIGVLTAQGLTAEQIDAAISNLTVETLQQAGSQVEAARLGAAAAAGSALESLRQAILVRTSSGEAVAEVAPDVVTQIEHLRSLVGERYVSDAPPFEAVGLVESYLELVRETIIATNAWDELAADLDFAYLCLVGMQFGLDAGTDKLARLIDAAEAAGTVPGDVAWLRGQAAQIAVAAAALDWTAVAAAVEQTSAFIVDVWGSSLPADAAYPLFAHLITMRNVALEGAAPSDLMPVGHTADFATIAGEEISTTPVSAFAPEFTVFRPVAAAQGFAEIVSDAESPLLRYAPTSDAEGPERISYVAIDPTTWQFHTTYAYGEVYTPLGFDEVLNEFDLEPDESKRFGFIAEVGQIIDFEMLDLDGEGSVVLTEPASGEVISFELFTSLDQILIDRSGLFVIEFTAFDEQASLSFAAQLITIAVEPIETGQRIAGTLATGQQRIFSFNLGGSDVSPFVYLDDLTDLTGNWWETNVQIVGPGGLVAGSFGGVDSGVIWTDTTGEFLVVLNNSGPFDFDFDFRVLTAAEATSVALDGAAMEQIDISYAAALFIVTDPAGGQFAVRDLGSTAFGGFWAVDIPQHANFGTDLGADGVALLHASGFAVLSVSSIVVVPVDIHLGLERIGSIALAGDTGEVFDSILPAESVGALSFTAAQGDVMLVDSLGEGEFVDSVSLYFQTPEGEIEFVGNAAFDSDPIAISSSGVHRLIVVNQGEEVVAPFRLLNLKQAPLITPSTGTIQREFTSGAETHFYRFEAVADTEVTVELLGLGEASGYWHLHAFENWFIDGSDWSEFSDPQEVLVGSTDTYYLVIENWTGGGSEYSLFIEGIASEPEPVEGDVDGDGLVNLVDLAILQRHFGATAGATRVMGDLDGDGDIDRADAARLARYFGASDDAGSLIAPAIATSPAAAIVVTAGRGRHAEPRMGARRSVRDANVVAEPGEPTRPTERISDIALSVGDRRARGLVANDVRSRRRVIDAVFSEAPSDPQVLEEGTLRRKSRRIAYIRARA